MCKSYPAILHAGSCATVATLVVYATATAILTRNNYPTQIKYCLGFTLSTLRSVSYRRVMTHHKAFIQECYVNTKSSITSKYCIKSQIYDAKINCIILHSFHNIKLLNANQMQEYKRMQMAIYVLNNYT